MFFLFSSFCWARFMGVGWVGGFAAEKMPEKMPEKKKKKKKIRKRKETKEGEFSCWYDMYVALPLFLIYHVSLLHFFFLKYRVLRSCLYSTSTIKGSSGKTDGRHYSCILLDDDGLSTSWKSSHRLDVIISSSSRSISKNGTLKYTYFILSTQKDEQKSCCPSHQDWIPLPADLSKHHLFLLFLY